MDNRHRQAFLRWRRSCEHGASLDPFDGCVVVHVELRVLFLSGGGYLPTFEGVAGILDKF